MSAATSPMSLRDSSSFKWLRLGNSTEMIPDRFEKLWIVPLKQAFALCKSRSCFASNLCARLTREGTDNAAGMAWELYMCLIAFLEVRVGSLFV